MAKNILIVDDEPTLVRGLRFNLEQQEGYVIDVAYDGEEALNIFDPEKMKAAGVEYYSIGR